ncbi:hypothetical protein NDA13_002029 [Ustilago tritici]|nr:hypothetical protein NDA13_002029 [Ustilago tritici]
MRPDDIMDMMPGTAATFLASFLTGPPPPPRPNTSCDLPIFDPSDTSATDGSLRLQHWSSFLDLYPDPTFAHQLRGALQHGIKLGYDGPLRHNARLEVTNLPMDPADESHLHREIDTRLREGRLRLVQDPTTINLVCSPVGVVPKPHSDKRRTIYHLSHPRRPGSRLPSINEGIHLSFVSIQYENLDTIIEFVRHHQGAHLRKADLEDAFRHIIVAKSDARLMGIRFDGSYFHECALAFGGRSSPFLFNLFAEFLHWITSFALQSLCSRILVCGCASLLDLQQVAGHLQFVTRVVPHGRAFLRRLYNAVKAYYKAPFLRRISKATRNELVWWTSTLVNWDGMSLLQPSPLVVEHIWTDASKRCVGGHWGTMESPRGVFSRELSRRHRQKDIRFLETLVVLDALRLFSKQWTGPRRVIIHTDNENVQFGLLKGSIRDPATQVLFREIFSLCLKHHVDLRIAAIRSKENILADALSRRRFSFIQQYYPQAFCLLQLGEASLSLPPALSPMPSFLQGSPSSSGMAWPPAPAPAPPHSASTTAVKTYHSVKRNLAILKSWHIDLGLPTTAFDSARLARVLRGYKRVVGNPAPNAKLPITLPLLKQLVAALPSVCLSKHNRRMFRAAFCLAFACFLRSGELTWKTSSLTVLTVGSVEFVHDGAFATIFLLSSKTDTFGTGVTLTAPSVPHKTCAVKALQIICKGRSSSAPCQRSRA